MSWKHPVEVIRRGVWVAIESGRAGRAVARDLGLSSENAQAGNLRDRGGRYVSPLSAGQQRAGWSRGMTIDAVAIFAQDEARCRGTRQLV
jgi:hypothetical protein